MKNHESFLERRRPLVARLATSTLLLYFIVGCTHVAQLDIQSSALPSVTKARTNVALVISKEFADFSHEYGSMGDKFVFPLGAGLKDYAKNVAQNRFETVTVVDSATEAAGKFDAILTPRAVKADESHGVFTFTERRVTLLVEWTLKDGDGVRPLWVDTITANAARKMGSAFTYKKNQKLLFQALFDDLSTKTMKAFEESSEVTRLAKPRVP
jgi:hypothetical protein